MKIMKGMNFFVEPETWKLFSELTKLNGTTMTKVLMQAIREYIEKEGKE